MIRRVNRKSGRKLDVLALLKGRYALSLAEIARYMRVDPRSAKRYIKELMQEDKVYRKYGVTPDGGGRPNYHYSLKRGSQ